MTQRGQDGDNAPKRGPVPSRPPRGASRANPSVKPGPKTGASEGGKTFGGAKASKDRPTRDRPAREPASREHSGREKAEGRGANAAPRARRPEQPEDGGWTYGIHAVETVLENAAEDVLELWVQTGDAGASRRRVRDAAEAHGLKIREVQPEELRRLLGDGANHQGVAALLSAFEYADPATILSKEGPQLIVVLDEVQDPHNFGAILRSAVGLGAAGVVIPKNRSVGVTPTVRKVSTGAVDQVPIARVTNLVRFMEDARDAGFWIYGTAVDEGEDVSSFSFAERAVLVFGSEGSGMRQLVQRSCDALVRLPLQDVESLNVSVACGIFLYAWRVQSGAKES